MADARTFQVGTQVATAAPDVVNVAVTEGDGIAFLVPAVLP